MLITQGSVREWSCSSQRENVGYRNTIKRDIRNIWYGKAKLAKRWSSFEIKNWVYLVPIRRWEEEIWRIREDSLINDC